MVLDEGDAVRPGHGVLHGDEHHAPVVPVLGSTDLMREERWIVWPTRSGGPVKAKRLPAHMRRGSETGGRKSPRSAMAVRADLEGAASRK